MKGFLPVQGLTRRIISAVNPECCQHMVHHLHSLILQHAEVSNQLQLGTRAGSAVLHAKPEKPVALTEQILECRWWKTPRERSLAISRPYTYNHQRRQSGVLSAHDASFA